MKTVLIEDDGGQWWKFEIHKDLQDHTQMTFWAAGYQGPYFAVQKYMEGDGWEPQEASFMGPGFDRCINGVLKTPHLLFGLAGEEGGVEGKKVFYRK